MDNYTKYIYLTICEISLILFEKDSNYTTYRGYCRGLSNSIDDGFLSVKETKDIKTISNNLCKIFALEYNVACIYIFDFFSSHRELEFEKRVRVGISNGNFNFFF